ncbi:DeoR/GlpR family DNA-binding transcription regulator [Dictyobacter kobayashii]|uniref:GntR family transcriptional regulator n=1 Tax=Dictyobacter kobayashii TaxID=2014872 RepID=A0A402AFR0_9CHLR|nr:DeoR/GlpR family DNA-binding transcription regulator [Dictyobacter kobayashii]GCE17960.1 GntR family transcriptional regulator [Dictyobacter kobayashii]
MSDATKRTDFILQELMANGRVLAEDLSQRLQVNSSTIRRDLEKLERQNLLRRVHGGAVPLDALSYSTYAEELTFQKNMGKLVDEKNRIAAAALRYIQPGDTLALSPGTTTTHLARYIRRAQIANLTVVTNAVNIAMELAQVPGLTLTLTGGFLLPDFFALVGPMAEQSLSQMFVAKAFIGVTGFSPTYGLTGPNQLEALTHKMTIERAQQTIVLADHTKLGKVALHAIAPISVVHTLITDTEIPTNILQELKETEVKVILAQ